MRNFKDIILEVAKSPDFEQGYKDAMERLKAVVEQMKADGKTDDEIESELESISKEVNGNPGRSKKNQSSNQTSQNNSNDDLEKDIQDAAGGQKSRTSKNDENQGVVRPEDCQGPPSLNGVPGTPGGMLDRATGDDIAKSEGYPDDGGSDASIEKEWKEQAIKTASKLKGDKEGYLKNKIEGLYKTSTDWRKELRKIIGYSISPDEKRQAYANKNVLVSQNRIARTDKDKYDNVDYITAFIDSSGSMSDDQLKMCLSEIYAMALQKKPLSIVIVQCDTKIQEVKIYSNPIQLKKDLKQATVKGRGGTNLKPCWDLLKNDPRFKRRQSELVMVFTDGYLDQYKRDPRTMRNLCWVIIDNPSFEVQYKDTNTKVVYIKSTDIK